MALYKRVDGKRIVMTEQEESEVRSEWDRNRKEAERRRSLKKENDNIREKALDKLYALSGLTDEEKRVMSGILK